MPQIQGSMPQIPERMAQTVTISIEIYERLLKDSVDFQKAKDCIAARDKRIEQLEKEVSTLRSKAINMDHLSAVSCLFNFSAGSHVQL